MKRIKHWQIVLSMGQNLSFVRVKNLSRCLSEAGSQGSETGRKRMMKRMMMVGEGDDDDGSGEGDDGGVCSWRMMMVRGG